MPKKPDREIAEAMLEKSRLPLSEAQKATLVGAYHHIAAMSERVRTATARPREAEPAMIFKADG